MCQFIHAKHWDYKGWASHRTLSCHPKNVFCHHGKTKRFCKHTSSCSWIWRGHHNMVLGWNAQLLIARWHISYVDHGTHNFGGGQSAHIVPQILVCICFYNQSLMLYEMIGRFLMDTQIHTIWSMRVVFFHPIPQLISICCSWIISLFLDESLCPENFVAYLSGVVISWALWHVHVRVHGHRFHKFLTHIYKRYYSIGQGCPLKKQKHVRMSN